MMMQLVFCYKYVCVEVYANYKSILQYSHHNVMVCLLEMTQHMLVMFYTICVFCTIRVWYVPYAYGTYHTRTV